MSETIRFFTNIIVRLIDRYCDDRFSKFLNPTPESKAIKRTAAKFRQYKRLLPSAFERLFVDPSATRAFGKLFSGDGDVGHIDHLARTLCDFLPPSTMTTTQARACIIYYAQCLRREYGRDNVIALLQYHATQGAPTSSRLPLDETAAVGRIGAASPPLLLGKPRDPEPSSAAEALWDRRIDEAREFFKLGETSRARKRYHAILDEVRDGSVASTRVLYRLHTNLAICSLATDALDDAESWLLKALQNKPLDDLAEALLARILLARGEAEAAKRKAKNILERNSTQSQAWIVIILTSVEPIAQSEIPGELRKEPDILLALSEHYVNLGQVPKAMSLVRDAAKRALANPQSCVSVAETLLYLGTQPTGTIPAQQDMKLIGNLLQTAIHIIGNVEQSSLLSRALCARSGLRLIVGDTDGAERDGQRAYHADKTHNEAAYAWARALGEGGDATRALFVLDQHESQDEDARMHALRARVLADIGGRDSEVEMLMRSAMELLGDSDDDRSVLLDLVNLASALGVTDLAEEILGRLRQNIPMHFASLVLARIARRKGKRRVALDNYSDAFSNAPESRRIPIAYEYASVARSFDAYSDVVDILKTVGVDEAPDAIRQTYVHSLVALERWDEVSALLQRMASSGELFADWALEVASLVALRRDDLEGAAHHLTQLLTQTTEDKAEIEARLAHTLLRMGRGEEAITLAHRACAREDITGTTRLELAKLLFLAGEYDAAIQTAFAALRQLPSNAEVDAVYVHIFGTSPEEISCKAEVTRVAVDTWVRLQGDDGSEATYWIFGDDATTSAHDELVASSPQGSLLLGRKVGDSMPQQPDSVDPVDFTVVEILPIWAHAFREALRRASTRISVERNPIQSIRIGDPPSLKFMSTITSMLHRTREAQAKVDRLYAEGRVPLGVLGHRADRTCRESYYHAAGLECGILVDSGTAVSLRDGITTVEAAGEVVLHTSALVTLQELGMLHVLPAVIGKPFIPTSAAIELRMEGTRARHELEGGDTAWAGLEDENIVLSQPSPDVAKKVLAALEELLDWIESSAIELPRPSETLKGGTPEIRDFLGASSYDAYMLAGPDRALYADDWGLRQLAAAERNASSFSTYALLRLARTREVVTLTEFCQGVHRLLELRHRFVPVSVDILLHAIREDAYQLGNGIKRCLRRLASGNVDSSAPVFASFVRELAVSDLGRGSVALASKYCASVLKELHPNDPHCLWTYRALARDALRLDPLLLEDVDRAFASDS